MKLYIILHLQNVTVGAIKHLEHELKGYFLPFKKIKCHIKQLLDLFEIAFTHKSKINVFNV